MPALLPESPAESRSYQLGATRLELASRDPEWLSYLDRRYADFPLIPESPVFEIQFDCDERPIPDGMSSPLATFPEAYELQTKPSGFRLHTETVTAEVDLRQRMATLRGPKATYPLDNLLRHLLPALPEQGVLFHAAALEGVLACGPSGAGKSTLARLVGDHALCDELCSVGRDDEGRFRLTSLPFWTARPGTSRLEAVLLLRHGSEHRLTRLSEGEALRRLTTQTLWPVARSNAMEAVLDEVLGLIRSAPVYELAFVKDASVWDFIEKSVLR